MGFGEWGWIIGMHEPVSNIGDGRFGGGEATQSRVEEGTVNKRNAAEVLAWHELSALGAEGHVQAAPGTHCAATQPERWRAEGGRVCACPCLYSQILGGMLVLTVLAALKPCGCHHS